MKRYTVIVRINEAGEFTGYYLGSGLEVTKNIDFAKNYQYSLEISPFEISPFDVVSKLLLIDKDNIWVVQTIEM